MPVQNPPQGTSAVCPYLMMKGADKAIEFYKNVFGAKEKFRMNGPDGKIGHAELDIRGCSVMLAEECEEMGDNFDHSGRSPLMVHVYVDDVDSVFGKALNSGATQMRPVENQFYGDRSGGFKDPWGHKWWVAKHMEDVSMDELKRRHEEMMRKKKAA